jgi:hypothetical protein
MINNKFKNNTVIKNYIFKYIKIILFLKNQFTIVQYQRGRRYSKGTTCTHVVYTHTYVHYTLDIHVHVHIYICIPSQNNDVMYHNKFNSSADNDIQHLFLACHFHVCLFDIELI